MPRQKDMRVQVDTKRKPQRRPPLGFSLGLTVVAISLKPFADKVANYTCSERNKKRYEYFQVNTPFLLPDWVRQHNNYIIKIARIKCYLIYFVKIYLIVYAKLFFFDFPTFWSVAKRSGYNMKAMFLFLN